MNTNKRQKMVIEVLELLTKEIRDECGMLCDEHECEHIYQHAISTIKQKYGIQEI